MASFPNDGAENTRTAINVMASFVVGDDPERSWAKVEEMMAEPYGVFRLVQGFISANLTLLGDLDDEATQHQPMTMTSSRWPSVARISGGGPNWHPNSAGTRQTSTTSPSHATVPTPPARRANRDPAMN
jgi:hypothetical protein